MPPDDRPRRASRTGSRAARARRDRGPADGPGARAPMPSRPSAASTRNRAAATPPGRRRPSGIITAVSRMASPCEGPDAANAWSHAPPPPPIPSPSSSASPSPSRARNRWGCGHASPSPRRSTRYLSDSCVGIFQPSRRWSGGRWRRPRRWAPSSRSLSSSPSPTRRWRTGWTFLGWRAWHSASREPLS